MDYALQKRLLRYLALGIAEDELDWTVHDNLKPPKLPSSNLARQYLAAHGLLSQYLPTSPTTTQDAAPPFDVQDFLSYLEGT